MADLAGRAEADAGVSLALNVSILYRGPLTACNYRCWYCPFPHSESTAEEQAADLSPLERLCGYLEQRRDDRLSIFFVPRGEALIDPAYQRAVARLSLLPPVVKVAIQTNLSCDLGWLDGCLAARVGLWCSYHPGQVRREEFLTKCRCLGEHGVAFSVGMVGVREHFEEIAAVREELSPDVYLWINAYKSEGDGYYRDEDVDRLSAIDPLFELSLHPHRSLGRPCRCGESVVAVEGDGTVRRCFFVDQPLGNLYRQPLETMLGRRPCPSDFCRCHIGYIHMDDLPGAQVFGHGILERIPRRRVAPAITRSPP